MIPTEYLGLIMLGLLLLTIFIGFPIAFTLMLLAVVFGYMGMEHRVFRLMVSQTFGIMQEEVLAAIPLFVLMGFFLERTGLMERLFRALQLSMGGLPGSLYLVTLLTATVFATATGIIGASVTVIGLLAVPVMLKYGYYPRLAAGVVCAGGTLGILIPPSIMLVLMAPVMGVSVLHLFAGAIIPGLLLAGMHIAYAMFRALKNPELGPPLPVEERAANWWVVVKELILGFVPAATLMFFALGTILLGIATPTEAAALGAFGALLMTVIYGTMTWKMFKECIMSTVQTSAMILFLAVSANIYAAVFSRLGSGTMVTNWFLNMPLEPFWIVVMMMILIFLLAWPLEWPAIVLIFLPILTPVVRELEIDLVWFGILVAVNLQSAFLSPPVAMAAYYLKGAVPILKLSDIYIGMLQFNVIQNLAVVLILIFPAIALWLPRVIYG
ncbi:MAG: TRAP transporter large permease [Salinarimonas sp.]